MIMNTIYYQKCELDETAKRIAQQNNERVIRWEIAITDNATVQLLVYATPDKGMTTNTHPIGI